MAVRNDGTVVDRPNVEGTGGAGTSWEYQDERAAAICRVATHWLKKIRIELLESTGRNPRKGKGFNHDSLLTMAERHALRSLYDNLCVYCLARYRLSNVKVSEETPESETGDTPLRYFKHAAAAMDRIEKILVRLGLSQTNIAKFREDPYGRVMAEAEDSGG